MEGLDEATKIEAIRKMKEPRIIMHPKDLEDLENYNKENVTNWKPSEFPRFKNIPIITRAEIERGKVVVFDDKYKDW